MKIEEDIQKFNATEDFEVLNNLFTEIEEDDTNLSDM